MATNLPGEPTIIMAGLIPCIIAGTLTGGFTLRAMPPIDTTGLASMGGSITRGFHQSLTAGVGLAARGIGTMAIISRLTQSTRALHSG
jgi:hypothetical protein